MYKTSHTEQNVVNVKQTQAYSRSYILCW